MVLNHGVAFEHSMKVYKPYVCTITVGIEFEHWSEKHVQNHGPSDG